MCLTKKAYNPVVLTRLYAFSCLRHTYCTFQLLS
uniref:Uncharacterized protein n=1 Tax=Siphoviridae sp. ctqwY3 TaxID=2827951 RepID=A0A8S5S7I0_9CAUD|nr:MAG TPA: hypothetical protein [Siphoviridae sp. ctqwY3]